MSKFTNENLLKEMLGSLEEIKKKLTSNNDSSDDGSDDSFSEIERVITKVQEEVKPDTNLLGKEKDSLEIKQETFIDILEKLLELLQALQSKEKEERKRSQSYINELENKIAELEKEINNIYYLQEQNAKDKATITHHYNRLKEAKNEINQCINNRAKKYVDEIIEKDYSHLAEKEKEALKKEIEAKAIAKAKEEELAQIREAEMIAKKYERDLDDDFER